MEELSEELRLKHIQELCLVMEKMFTDFFEEKKISGPEEANISINALAKCSGILIGIACCENQKIEDLVETFTNSVLHASKNSYKIKQEILSE